MKMQEKETFPQLMTPLGVTRKECGAPLPTNSKRSLFMEVLYPRAFPNNPRRAQVTRTIQQPEIDKFEQAETGTMAGGRFTQSCSAGGVA